MYIMTMRKIVKEGMEMFRDATSMAQAVRDKQVSSLELVLETIEKGHLVPMVLVCLKIIFVMKRVIL